LAIREKVLGAEHPSTATTYNNIAGVYKDQGDYAKARDLLCRAVIIYIICNLAEHPYAKSSFAAMHHCYEKAGGKEENFQTWFAEFIKSYPVMLCFHGFLFPRCTFILLAALDARKLVPQGMN
jgi:tetratricopeptide (TPR) repeat protein